jgi:pimeloyl-ACP methyl ester carboxylesterase
LTNTNGPDDASIPASAVQIQAPVLLITATEDPIGLPVNAINGTQPFATNLRVRPITSGHFVQVEASEETNKVLEEFFVEVLNNSTGY